ncbi:MAG: AAA family ATPase [Clostridiales bacterium]|nr:AAA family ATPase [Clostridiales bacterium]
MNDWIKKMPFFQTLAREIRAVYIKGYRYIHILTDDREVAEQAIKLYAEIYPMPQNNTGKASGTGTKKNNTKAGQGRSSLDSSGVVDYKVIHISDINKDNREDIKAAPQVCYGHIAQEKDSANPYRMENIIATLELPPMDREDIRTIIWNEAKNFRKEAFGGGADTSDIPFEIDEETVRWYCNRMKRMEFCEIRRIIRGFLRCGRCSENFECLYEKSLQEKFRENTQCAEQHFIVAAKNEKLKKHNKLECIRIMDGENYELCGAGAITKWFNDHEAALTGWNGTLAPKGMFLVGVPGTGKSLTAKYAAKRLKLPLVKLDVSKILGRYVGESEHGMQEAMEDLAFNAPCIVLIDEIEKSFGEGKEDGSGVMSRLFGQLLNFMQEKKERVFVIATANSIQKLPPELMRLGRFDIHFKMMMPTWSECKTLLENSFEKARQELASAYGTEEKTGIINSALTKLETVLQVITGYEDGKWKFVTGADIDTIVREIVQLSMKGKYRETSVEDLARMVTGYISVTAEQENPASLEKLAASYLNLLPQAFGLANAEPDLRNGEGSMDISFGQGGKKTDNPFRDAVLDKRKVLDYTGDKPSDINKPSCLPLEPSCGQEYDKQLYRCLVKEMNRILVRDPDCLDKVAVMKAMQDD